MNRILSRYGIGLAAILLVPVMGIAADTAEDIRETARLLAILLDSGRLAVGRNQDLINDPSQGSGPFTSDKFAAETIGIFKERTGHDLADLSTATVPAISKELLARLLEASSKTVASYEPVLRMNGFKYKGLIPATFGTETATRFQKWSGIYMKQTAPAPLLRNLVNKADAFEDQHMKALTTSSIQHGGETVITDVVDGSVRVLLPLFYEKACLSCHGDPKGERDISGYRKEGAKEGQLAGVISVRIDKTNFGTP
jgi:hypothetical protein